jgi:hypothetical protein
VARFRKRWIKSIVRPFIFVFLVVCISGFGLVGYDVTFGDGEIPDFYNKGKSENKLVRLAKHNSTAHLSGKFYTLTPEQIWEGLRPSVHIVREINPQAADWLEETHRVGKVRILHEEEAAYNCGSLAKFDFFNHNLYVGPSILADEDGLKAVVLIHEYRHSLQNRGKIFRYIMSYFIGPGQPDIVENDAMLYEAQAVIAIYGEPF